MKPQPYLLAVLVWAVAIESFGAAAPAVPASAPSTAPAWKVVIPGGYKVVTANGRHVICEAADEPWIAVALNKIQPTTRPATLPAKLLERLVTQRATLLQELAKDLALKDLAAAAATYDKELIDSIRALDAYHPNIYYLVTPPDHMSSIMRNGWTSPHFYYNRAADAVTFNEYGVLATDRPQDDVVFPAAFDASEKTDKRSERLSIGIGATEASIEASIEIKGRITVGATFAKIIGDNGMDPLKLKEDQVWFGHGVANILSAKYTSVITGESKDGLMDLLSTEHPANPVEMSGVDLVHPTDTKLMREEVLPAYYDAFRRKGARAVRFLLEKGGDDAVRKAIIAITDKKPTDGVGMVNVIKDATGVDVMPLLVTGS